MHQTISFRAMNTQIQVLVEPKSEGVNLAPHIRQYFANAEVRFSRFLPDSECSYLNRHAGSRCLISLEMAELLEQSQHHYERTEGIFTIAILPALERAGYVGSFETLQQHEIERFTDSDPLIPFSAKHTQLDYDRNMQSVLLTSQQRIDLGGIGKSWTVQGLAADLRSDWQVQRGLIQAGGDVEVWGGASDTEPWVIAVANPQSEYPVDEALLLMRDGAIATSSTQRRRWETSEGSMHHLIDPRTMAPSQSSVVQCSVVGAHLVDCEIWAKVICILGIEEGIALFKRKTERMEAIIYTNDGAVHHVKPAAKWFYGEWIGLRADEVHE
ncbi:FAD:protein FMN transferase [Paenibacillus marchantiophytorum]|uniref:FAD:protein FMN transferase n=1 Tax=Paenibacillus marchantiophytorum TaxID=1619310 RepID=A0ABQ2BP97_9BACL|nr:FAD:protein FMN transferase [Paenibacillus marchantiophytorum]GGI44287.1 FAD:protein FMN transferase [Paenibacillus marchantiophytorum]